MTVKLLTEHYLEFFSLKGGCTGLSESILVKMPHCWKSHIIVHFSVDIRRQKEIMLCQVSPIDLLCSIFLHTR